MKCSKCRWDFRWQDCELVCGCFSHKSKGGWQRRSKERRRRASHFGIGVRVPRKPGACGSQTLRPATFSHSGDAPEAVEPAKSLGTKGASGWGGEGDVHLVTPKPPLPRLAGGN